MIGRLRVLLGWPVILPAIAGLAALVAGIVAAGQLDAKAPPPASKWKPPELAIGTMQANARAVGAKGLWGSAVQPGGTPGGGPAGEKPPLTPPDWRVIGMAINGPTRVVYVQVGKEPLMELSVGDKLPGGAEIKGIEPGRLLLLVEGKRRVLALDER